jgi:hypothetical protein
VVSDAASPDAGAVSGPALARRAVGTPIRRVLLAVALAVAVLAAAVLTTSLPATGRTFVSLSASVQSLLSIFVPFFAVLLASDLRRSRRPGHPIRPRPIWIAAGLLALGFGLVGIAVSATATALGPDSTGIDRWASWPLIVFGSLVLQLIAAGVGTAAGLLLRPVWLADLATVVVPLGCYLVLGTTATLRLVREWTTPFAAVQRLFTGQLTLLGWLQWAVVAAFWVVAANAVALLVRGRRDR